MIILWWEACADLISAGQKGVNGFELNYNRTYINTWWRRVESNHRRGAYERKNL